MKKRFFHARVNRNSGSQIEVAVQLVEMVEKLYGSELA